MLMIYWDFAQNLRVKCGSNVEPKMINKPADANHGRHARADRRLFVFKLIRREWHVHIANEVFLWK